MTDERDRLAREAEEAKARVKERRQERTARARALREEGTAEAKQALARATEALREAETGLEEATRALAIGQATGSAFGLVLGEDGALRGAVALLVPPGTAKDERARLIADALAEELTELASAHGLVLSASPDRYARERPGRDPEGRTILDVSGRAEGDYLVPSAPKKRA